MKQTILDKNELEYFFVEESYGGNQDLFPDVTMRDGGCGAIAACESCIYKESLSTSVAGNQLERIS